jgi:HlyD family secretion protein
MSQDQRHADLEVMKILGVESSGRRRAAKLAWTAGTVAFIALAAYGVIQYLGQRARAREPKYQTEAVTIGDIQVVVSATGTLKGQNTVEVGAEVSGRLSKVYVDFNDHVTPGQLLAEIDPEQLKAAVDEAQARVAEADAATKQAKATLLESRQNADRAAQQAEQGLVSQKELEAAKAALARAQASAESAAANAQVARATLKSQASRLDKTRIVSPIDGIVLSRLVEPGQTVTAGFQTPVLFKLAEDLRRMSLYVYVDEADIGRTREGQSASFTVDAYPDKVFPSKLLSLRNEPKEDQNVVTYEAVLAVDNGELLLRPGMTATATIVADLRKQVLSVPNAALRFTPPNLPREETLKPRGRGVWVPAKAGAEKAEKDRQPRFVPLKTGASDGRRSEVLSGALRAGNEVLVDVIEEKKK